MLDNASLIEVVWTVLALIGLGVTGTVTRDAFEQRKAQKAVGWNHDAQLLAQQGVVVALAWSYVLFINLLVGIASMGLPPSGSRASTASYVISALFMTEEVVAIGMALLSLKVRRTLLGSNRGGHYDHRHPLSQPLDSEQAEEDMARGEDDEGPSPTERERRDSARTEIQDEREVRQGDRDIAQNQRKDVQDTRERSQNIRDDEGG